MNKLLKKNICDLSTLYILNEDIDDLAKHRGKYIGSGLEYACKSWARHLRLGIGFKDGGIGHIVKSLDIFLRDQSLVRDLHCAIYFLGDVNAWLAAVSAFESLDSLVIYH
jgi:hypothetical protein